jgi:hypothetical protein
MSDFPKTASKIDFSGDLFLWLGFRGTHVLVTYAYVSTVLAKEKPHPETVS